ncbi:MAG: glycoside hydrolase family 5 protein [Terriglobales bacterium]
MAFLFRKSRRLFATIFISALFLHSPWTLAQSDSPVVPANSGLAHRRAQALRHGINLSGWFAQVYDPKGYTKEHFESSTTPQDIALIKAMGFDHVRLSVNPAPMFRPGHADEIPAEYLSYLDAAVKMILDHGLSVIIDIHPESDFKAKLATDSFVEQFADYWRGLAHHYSNLDPNRVFFEILNEPEMSDRYRWYGIQTKLATAIREGAPQHTIIVAGARYSSNDELLFLDPLADPNVIYNFHFYEPHVFTHQGATWGVNYWHFEHGLSYPSNERSAEKVAAEVPDATNRMEILRYGMDHWDAARIGMEIGQVAEWARRWHVPVTCNEFGAFRKYTAPADRAAWIHDVRTTLEQNGIGWTMWDYSGGFGVVTKVDGKAIPDEVTMQALGLKMPASAPQP